MKLQLNAGDWATIAFFALAVSLGCYADANRRPMTVANAPVNSPTAER